MADTETIKVPARGAGETRSPIVEVRDLEVVFDTDRGPVTAVGGIDLTLRSGEIHALVGESGSGKSVTGLTMMGLSRGPRTHVRGTIDYGGRNLIEAPDSWMRSLRGTEFGMVFQDPMTSLNPMHRVGHQVAETLRINADMTRRAANARAVELLASVGIRDPHRAARKYPHEFSGGMRQRVVIAIALACEPAVLVADEPTTALDVSVQAQILELMVSLAAEYDTAVLLITHDLGVVARYADSVSVMRHGSIVERGDTDAVLSRPEHPYTQALMTAIPRLRGPRRRYLSADRAGA